ncbi:hypothetical protein [Pedobacter sp. SG908]|uniref:hypothetical protein n=1 Tax=Pedobacter sp. SG908 TaxID=2587135 RepID=UPI001422C61E|nr:hypothetical protein [Pedobacter sp. SG908]NII83115.1 hypothetical protein [Pedobacter sp. SG908]
MRRNFWYLAAGVALLFVSLFLFTRKAWWSSWDFSATGQIGDTIGGITAPFFRR